MTILPVWLTGTKYPPTASQVAGVYCGRCGHSHNHPICTPSLFERIHYKWKYLTNRTFRQAIKDEDMLSEMLVTEIRKEINREIVKKLKESV